MLTAYMDAAMRRAEFEDLGAEGWFGGIPGLDGVWASGASPEAVRTELRGVLEGWILLGLRLGHALPVVDGIELTPALRPAS